MKTWRLFPTLSAPMPLQMTLDRLLFEKHRAEPVSAPLFRIFYASEPWVTVGYAADKNPSYLISGSKHPLTDLPACRRVTGGGTVIHGSDLIFSLCARAEDEAEKFASVEVSYRHFHEAVRLAFKNLGHNADFYAEAPLAPGRDCFLNPVSTDLKIGARKVAGGAQKRSENVFLHEESIQPPKGVSLSLLESEIMKAFATYFGVTLEPEQIDPRILADAQAEAQACVVRFNAAQFIA